MEWEIVPRTEMQGMALVVVKEREAVTKGKVGEASVDNFQTRGRAGLNRLRKAGRDGGFAESEA